MTIKTFDFPSFEEWYKTRIYSQKIGDYTCAIEAVGFGFDGDPRVDYRAAIANSDSPTDSFVRKTFEAYIRCDVSDSNTLKKWYEAVIVKFNDKWKNFILETYLSTEEVSHNIAYDAVKVDDDTKWHCPICNAYVYENEHRCPECNSEIRIPHE